MMTKRQLSLFAAVGIVLAAAFLQAGCAKTLTPSHPNQINQFDGVAYDTLITVQGSLNQAKMLAPQFPQFKTELNQAIAAYNSAIAAYKLYHSAGTGAPDATALQTQITALVGSVSKLLSDLGVKIQ